MSKNIVLCIDGTWNKPDEKLHNENEETNVRNLWELLEKNNSAKQVVYYDEGVGAHWYDQIMGGISGKGLSKNIREAYFELCKSYHTGDKVFIFGFSRGAYTARSLAGMIYSCGLLNNENLTEQSVKHAFDIYKKSDESVRSNFKKNNIKCEIETLGVWDTVGSLGIPIGFLKKISSRYIQFHDTKINKEIKNAYHAVSIDEQRSAFLPTLWDVNLAKKHQVVEQVWFSGVHSDIGGGYKERHHSDIPFQWMISKLKGKVIFNNKTYPYSDDVSQQIHDSYKIYYGGKQPRVATVTDTYTPKVHISVLDKLNKINSYEPLALVALKDRTTLLPYIITE